MEDILGLGKLALSLLQSLGKAAGFLLAPQHIKRLAKASAEAAKEAKEIAPEDSIITIDDGKVKIQTNGQSVTLPDQISRMVKKELQKENNTDEIVTKALELLEKEKDQDKNVDLDDDWINHFLDDSALVSDEEMQDIWAHILAGESVKKGSFSIRTLELLRGLSKEEAQTFTKCCKNSFQFGGMPILIDLQTNQPEYDLNLLDIMKMNDCGLLNDSGKLLSFQKEKPYQFQKNNLLYLLKAGENRTLPMNMFTQVGQELSKLIQEKKEFSDSQIKIIFSKNPADIIEVHEMINEDQYRTSPIRMIA